MLYVQNNNIKMDSFELNKVIAAILMVVLLVIGLGKIADGIFHVNKPENPGYKIEIAEQKTTNTMFLKNKRDKNTIAI